MNPPKVEILRTISKFRKRGQTSSALAQFLCKTWKEAFSRRSRAETPRKCTKKRAARAKIAFWRSRRRRRCRRRRRRLRWRWQRERLKHSWFRSRLHCSSKMFQWTIFFPCKPFTRNRANSATDCSTVCRSKTHDKVSQVPCKRNVDQRKFLSV